MGVLAHESPVLEGKAPLERIEWQVTTRALGVVVWAGELCAGRLEAAAGDERRGRGRTEGSARKHLARVSEGRQWRWCRGTLVGW